MRQLSRRRPDNRTADDEPGHRTITDRQLKIWLGAALLFSATLSVIFASMLPQVMPDQHAWFWRWGMGLPAFALCGVILWLGPRLSERWFQPVLELCMVPALNANIIMLAITPATKLVLINLMVTLIYAGYFVRPKALVATVSWGMAIALSALFFSPARDTPHIGSFLVIYVATVLVMVLMLHLQNSETMRAVERAHRRGRSDPLTGLANLRALEQHAAELFRPETVDGSTEMPGLLLLDLDNFKSANTLYGHLGGDHALREISRQLLRVAPPGALIARIGGDEFAVLLQADSPQRISEHAECLRGSVRGASTTMEMPGVTIDATVGIALYPRDGSSLSELLDVADGAMYEQKGSKQHTVPDPSRVPGSGARPAWMDQEVSAADEQDERALTYDDIVGGRIPALSRFTLYARASTVTWSVGTVVLALSLLTPDAYEDPALAWWMVLLVGLGVTPLILLVNPDPRTWQHFMLDLASLVAIVGVIAATGGVSSTALPLLVLVAISQAQFWGTRILPFRLFGVIAVALSPLAYTAIGGTDVEVRELLTLFAITVVLMILVAAMYADRVVLARLKRRAERLATTDALTGIDNRRAFEDYVQSLLGAADAPSFAIVVLDLDNFKQVNTLHGHRAGDAVLREIALTLGRSARHGDCIARIGGDEFAAVLPGVELEAARSLAERFVMAVRSTSVARDSEISASAGFALHPEHGTTLDELVFTADAALMTVKASGKGIARVAEAV